jgi:hypothetical protein
MGVWFLTIAVGFQLGGLAGSLWTRMSHAAFFGAWVALCFGGAIVFTLLLPTIKRLSHGAE